uniref:Fe2OG dioxygenase domain-containing protein n=1 Tax=Trypanosoma congolense (strain IL3000) TaxID=1068625 RepID=G0UPJ1_TRYCI|nr:conserved hypothetical protein [Trypanosoma congolense IL3000]
MTATHNDVVKVEKVLGSPRELTRVRFRCRRCLLRVATYISPIENYIVAPGSYQPLGLIALNCGIQTGSSPFHIRQALRANTTLPDAALELFYSSKLPFTLIFGNGSVADVFHPLKEKFMEVATVNGGPTGYVCIVPVSDHSLWKGGLPSNSGAPMIYLLSCKGDAVLRALSAVFQPPTIGADMAVINNILQPSMCDSMGHENSTNLAPHSSDDVESNYSVKNIDKARNVECVAVPQIRGLYIISNFLTPLEHNTIWKELKGEGASAYAIEKLARRDVAHFNRRFYYGINLVGAAGVDANPKPSFYDWMIRRMRNEDSRVKVLNYPLVPHAPTFDQLTVNFYNYTDTKGKSAPGIAHHVDSHSAFDDCVAIVSLGSHTVIEFSRHDRPPETVAPLNVLVAPCSLLLMTGEARYCWTHCISEKREDVVSDRTPPLPRSDRVSLTWRCGRTNRHNREDCICRALCDAK